MNFIKTNIAGIASEIKTGKTPPTSNPEYFRDEINWYTPGDLDKGKFLSKSQRRISKKAIDDKKAVIFKPNTLLIGCIGDIGKIGITTGVSSSNQQLTGLLPDDKKVTTEYLYYWLKSKKKLFQNTSTNAIVPILNNRQLGSIKISIPENLSYQIFITDILSKAENLISQRKQSIAFLDEFLKSTFLEMFGDPVINEKGWENCQLKEILEIRHGFAFKSEFFSNSGEYVLLTPGNFYEEGGYRNRGEKQKYYVGTFPKEYLLDEGNLLIAMTEQAPGLLGSPIIVPQSNIFLHNQRLGLALFDEKVLSNIFLFHLFNFHKIRSIIHSKATGTKVRHTSPTKIQEIRVGIPPIDHQLQFAQIVEKTEALKIQYQSSLQELENLYGCLSQRAFRGEL